MRNAAIVVVMLLVTVPVFGDQSKADAEANKRFGALRSQKPSDSYGNLFKAQEMLKQAQGALPKTTVVCGMTIIPADPKIDPKMSMTPEKRDNVEHTIRAIEPPICKGQ